MSNSANCSFLGEYHNVITWIVVIAGWFLINNQHNARESRKEVRSDLNGIKDALDSLENLAISYHTEDHDPHLANEIRLKISRISQMIKTARIISNEESNKCIIKLRKAITYDNFDSADHTPKEYGDEIISEISSSIDDIVHKLEKSFRDNYPR